MLSNNDFAKLIYRTHASTEFGILVQFPFNVTHPIPDLNATHIMGRNGDFIQDEGSFQDVTETFNVIVNRPVKYQSHLEAELEISDWLRKSDSGKPYDYLKFDFLPGYIFEAAIKDPFSLTWQSDFYATGTIPFFCKPFLKRTDGIDYKPVPHIDCTNLPGTANLFNQENTIAVPDWHIVGNGNFTITINGFPYEFSDIEDEVWLDGQEANATTELDGDDTTLINNQMRLANNTTPKLFPGENTFKLSVDAGSTVTKVEYKPNWGRLI